MDCDGIRSQLARLKDGVIYQCARAHFKGRELFYINEKHDPDWLARAGLVVEAIGGENFRKVGMYKQEIEKEVAWILKETRKLNLRH